MSSPSENIELRLHQLSQQISALIQCLDLQMYQAGGSPAPDWMGEVAARIVCEVAQLVPDPEYFRNVPQKTLNLRSVESVLKCASTPFGIRFVLALAWAAAKDYTAEPPAPMGFRPESR